MTLGSLAISTGGVVRVRGKVTRVYRRAREMRWAEFATAWGLAKRLAVRSDGDASLNSAIQLSMIREATRWTAVRACPSVQASTRGVSPFPYSVAALARRFLSEPVGLFGYASFCFRSRLVLPEVQLYNNVQLPTRFLRIFFTIGSNGLRGLRGREGSLGRARSAFPEPDLQDARPPRRDALRDQIRAP